MRGRLPRAAIATLAALMLVGLVPGTAAAHDHELPSATLRVGSRIQEGSMFHAYWAWADSPDTCIIFDMIGILDFSQTLRLRPGGTAEIELSKIERPTLNFLNAWSRVDRYGSPMGDPKPVDFRVRRVDGTWRVRFHAPSEPGHMYLAFDSFWRDREGCMYPRERQSGSWAFHIRVV